MSLIPLLFSDWWEDLDEPHHLLDQDFGGGLHAHQLVASPRRLQLRPRERRHPATLNYYRPWAELLRGNERGSSVLQSDKDKFQCTLDVQQFKPEEIEVKVVDKCVVVSAKHEEKKDEHGWISRQFTRKYLIPEQCDIDKVVSKLSSDGVLSIVVPRKEESKTKNEKNIKIELTGAPAIKEKTDKKMNGDAPEKK